MHPAIRVATFNVQHGVAAVGRRVDNDALARSCAALDADLLAVQEVDVDVGRSGRVDQVGLIGSATGLSGRFAPTVEVDGGRYGHALFARGEIAVLDEIPLDPRGAEPRAALLCDVLLVEEARVRVLSTHLSVDRLTARSQLRSLVARVGQGSTPTVFLGDCNLPRRAVRATVQPWRLSVVRSRPTFPSSWPYRWIDHIAVPAGAGVKQVDVRRFAVSDHRALIATVQLADPRWNP